MKIQRVLGSLLILSFVHIGFLMLLLLKTSNWTHHIQVALSFTHIQEMVSEKRLKSSVSFLGPNLTTVIPPSTATQRPNVKSWTKSDVKKIHKQMHNNIMTVSRFPITPLQNVHHPLYKMSGDVTTKKSHPSKKVCESDGAVVITINGTTFSIAKNFAFPHFKCILHSTTEIAETLWVKNLAKMMANVRVKTIYTVTVTATYQSSLLNWLISAVSRARVTLGQILVIALDRQTQDFLQRYKIQTIYVPPRSLFSISSKISHYGLVMFTRISVVRLLNHWGFSVILADTDAIILKNPQPLFDKHLSSDIVASSGKQPLTLYNVWNIAVCNGLLLIRSSQETEQLWQKLVQIDLDSPMYNIQYSDQLLFNYGLENLEISWQKYGELEDAYFEGDCKVNGMRVTTIPLSLVCRENCRREIIESVYVWHPLTEPNGNAKVAAADEYHLKFLSQRWSENEDCNQVTGELWLRCISDGTAH